MYQAEYDTKQFVSQYPADGWSCKVQNVRWMVTPDSLRQRKALSYRKEQSLIFKFRLSTRD